MSNEDEFSLDNSQNHRPRDRGFLTESDRELLRTPKEDLDISEGAWYNARRRMVTRTRNALRDFSLVYEYMDESDRKKVFYTPSNVRSDRSNELPDHAGKRVEDGPTTEWVRRIRTSNDLFIGRGAWCALAFIYEQVGEEEFEYMVERALAHVFTGNRTPGTTSPALAGIDVSISVEHADTAKPTIIAQKIHKDDLDHFTNAELNVLFRIVRETGGQMPTTAEEFLNLFREYMNEDERNDPPHPEDVVFTVDPFTIVENHDG